MCDIIENIIILIKIISNKIKLLVDRIMSPLPLPRPVVVEEEHRVVLLVVWMAYISWSSGPGGESHVNRSIWGLEAEADSKARAAYP